MSATQWEDLLVRNSTSDTGLIPAQGGLSSSPDVWPEGKEPLTTPESLTEHMTSEPNQNVYAGEGNYLYVRGVNKAPHKQSGMIHLYYSRASLLSYPKQWQNNELKRNNGEPGSPVTAESGANFVTKEPFFWENVPQPPEGDHYCLISRVETTDNPNPVPKVFQIPDFAKFISENRGYAWRNIVVVADPDAPTFEEGIHYEQGEKKEEVHFIVECLNVEPGCFVGFNCGTAGPEPLINLPKTEVTKSTANLGMTTEVPAGFDSTITLLYWSGGKTQPENAKITLRAVWIPPSTAEWEDIGVPAEELLTKEILSAQAGPVRAVALGSVGLQFKR